MLRAARSIQSDAGNKPKSVQGVQEQDGELSAVLSQSLIAYFNIKSSLPVL